MKDGIISKEIDNYGKVFIDLFLNCDPGFPKTIELREAIEKYGSIKMSNEDDVKAFFKPLIKRAKKVVLSLSLKKLRNEPLLDLFTSSLTHEIRYSNLDGCLDMTLRVDSKELLDYKINHLAESSFKSALRVMFKRMRQELKGSMQ